MALLSPPGRHALALLSSAGLLCLAPGCHESPDAGGQTGDLSLGGDDDDPGAGGNNETPHEADISAVVECDETPEAISDPDAATDLDFAPSDILDFANAEFSATLAWASSEFVEVSASGTTEVTVSIEYDDGEIRYVRREPAEPEGTGESEQAERSEATLEATSGTGIATTSAVAGVGGCLDRLELDVTVNLTTADGALDETFDATLRAIDANFARFTFDVDFGNLDGELMVEPVEPEDGTAELANTVLDVTVSPWGSTGMLTAMIETRIEASGSDPGAISEGPIGSATVSDGISVGSGNALATWPADVTCGDEPAQSHIATETDADVDGVSGEEVVETLNDIGPIEVEWEDGSSTELSFDVAVLDYACVLTDEFSGVAVRVPVTLSVQTADGTPDGEVEAFASASTNDGSPNNFSVYHYATLTSQSELDALGFSDVDIDDYDSVDFSFYLYLEDDGTEPQGSLQLNGMSTPECSTEIITEPDGSASTPGCPGSTLEPLVSGSWGSDEPVEPLLAE